MPKTPSHIHTTPHPDWPQRLTELRDIDLSKVDREDESKSYVLKYNSDKKKRGRFFWLVPWTWSWEDQQLSLNCLNKRLRISWDWGNEVDLSCLFDDNGQPLIISNELWINKSEPEVVGKQYQTFANAFAYLNTLPTALAPSQMNRWAIRFSWTHMEELDVPEYVHLVGDWKNTSALFGGVSFMGEWSSFVSANSAYNCLINLDQKSYSMPADPIQTQVDVMFSEYLNYVPPFIVIFFKIAPTTWQIRVRIFGDEFLFGPGTTAQQMQDEIRNYSSKFSQVVVGWAMVDDGNLEIGLHGLPNLVVSEEMGMADIYTSDAVMKAYLKLGQNQEIYFGFSEMPEGWSFDLTFNNNDSVQILYSDIDENSNILETKINDRFTQTYAPNNPWAFWVINVQRTSATSFNLILRISWQPYNVWVANNSLFFLDTPVGVWPRIWLYDCGIWDAQSEVVSRLNLFNTDIYKWDFEYIDVNIEWWYIDSSLWDIKFLRSITANNSTFNASYQQIFVSEAQFMNSVIMWENRVFPYDNVRRFIGCYIPDDIEILQWTTEMYNCCGVWKVYYGGWLFFRWVNWKTPVNTWDGTFVNYWDYYDNKATWLAANNLQSAIDELFFYNRKSQYLSISGTYYFSKVDAKKFFSLSVGQGAICSMDSSFDLDDVLVFHNRYTEHPLTVYWFTQQIHLVWEWNVTSFKLYPGEIAIGKKTGWSDWTFHKTTKYLSWDHIAINDNVISATYHNATQLADWLMSKEDKIIVDWLSDVATSWSYADLIDTPDLSVLAEIVEVSNYANLPWTWETWKVYITVDTGYMYRWNWTWYTQLTDQTAIRWQISGTLLNQIDLKNALDAKQDKLIEWNNITIDQDWKTINADYAEISETDIKDTVGQTKWLLTGRRIQKYKEDMLDPLYATKTELTIIPQNKQNNDYTLTIDDAGKHLYYDDNVTHIWTIPADNDVAYPIGTTITFINWGSDDMVIKVDQDTMVLVDSWTIGDRTLAPNWVATATKVDNTRRFISWNWII